MLVCEISLQIGITHFVKVLEFSKIIALLLDGIVCQMYEFVVEIFKIKFARASSDVTIFVEIALELFVNTGCQGENSEIKLSPVDQKGIVNVLLYDHSCFLRLSSCSSAC